MGKLSCESCGANLDPSHLACPFCKAATPYASEQRQRQERMRDQQTVAEAVAKQRYEADARTNAQVEATRIGWQSVVWSGVGIFFCFFPIPAIVALVLVYRARAIARERGLIVPGQATVGLVLSVLTLLSSVAFYIFAALSPAKTHADYAPSVSTLPATPHVAPYVAPHHATAAPSASPRPTPAPKPH